MSDMNTRPQDADEQTGPEMSQQDIEQEADGEELPDREAMSLVNANLALPINAAVAANVLSDGSIAYANANQADHIGQGIGSSPSGTTPSGG
jgi:hypothetical protein